MSFFFSHWRIFFFLQFLDSLTGSLHLRLFQCHSALFDSDGVFGPLIKIRAEQFDFH